MGAFLCLNLSRQVSVLMALAGVLGVQPVLDAIFISGGPMMKVSDDLLTLMIELEEKNLKEYPSFQGECRLTTYLELKQFRAEERFCKAANDAKPVA